MLLFFPDVLGLLSPMDLVLSVRYLCCLLTLGVGMLVDVMEKAKM